VFGALVVGEEVVGLDEVGCAVALLFGAEVGSGVGTGVGSGVGPGVGTYVG